MGKNLFTFRLIPAILGLVTTYFYFNPSENNSSESIKNISQPSQSVLISKSEGPARNPSSTEKSSSQKVNIEFENPNRNKQRYGSSQQYMPLEKSFSKTNNMLVPVKPELLRKAIDETMTQVEGSSNLSTSLSSSSSSDSNSGIMGAPNSSQDAGNKNANIFFGKISEKKTSNAPAPKPPKLQGHIFPLENFDLVKTSPFSLIDSAYAISCSAMINLYELDVNGIPSTTPLKTLVVKGDATYSFDVTQLGLKLNSPNYYLLHVLGCNNSYSRIVTDFYKDQNINIDTTLITKVLDVSSNLKVSNADIRALAKLTDIGESLNSSTFDESYTALKANPVSSENFQKAFNSPITILTDTKPLITDDSISLIASEGTASPLIIAPEHWYSNYNMVIEWSLDGQFISTIPVLNYLPGKNEQGNHTVTVKVGKDNGSARVDTTKPYETKSWVLSTLDIYPVSSPSFTLDVVNPSPVLSDTIDLEVSTGANLISCETISDMAITESNVTPLPAAFNYSCSDDMTQKVSYTLTAGSDGPQTLYLWGRDSSGNIGTPTTLNYRRDTTVPTSAITNLATTVQGGSTQTISFSSSDDNQVSKQELYYQKDSNSAFVKFATLAAGTTSYNWTLPVDDTTEAIVKIVTTDEAGKTSEAQTAAFTIDSTGPAAVALTVTTPNPTKSTSIYFTINSCTDYSKIFINDGTTPSASDSGWANCSTAASAFNGTIPATDGDHTFTVWGIDSIGNISLPQTVTHHYDLAPPVAPTLSLHSAPISASTLTSFTVTDCLDRASVLISESPITPAENDTSWQSCVTSTGGISYTLIGPVVQGTHNLYAYAKDGLGNISTSTALSMAYDTTLPALSLDAFATLLRGGNTLSLTFASSDISGLSLFKIEYASNGTTFSDVEILDEADTTYSWTIPSDDTSTAIIRLTSKDNSSPANTRIVTSAAFTIDSTAPAPPAVTLASNFNTNSTAATLTVSDCTDRPMVLVNESTQPSRTDANWVSCVTTAGGIAYTLNNTQGTRNLKVWSKDTAGNISATATNVALYLDNVVPDIQINAQNILGNSISAVSFALYELNASAAQSFAVEYYNGSIWQNITVASTNGPHNGTVFSTNISAPNSEGTLLTFKVTYTDTFGNTGTSSVQFKTDINPPIVTALLLNDEDLRATNNNLKIELNASDNTSKVQYFCLKYDDSVKPTANASCWRNVESPIPGITAATAIQFSNYYFQIGYIKGFYNVYAWVKDETGNISNNSNTLNVDKYLIEFDPETPPVISALVAVNSNTPPPAITASDLDAPAGSDIYVKWHASDIEGFSSNPIKIAYSINDVDFIPLTGNLINGDNGSCTVDPGYTGCAKISSPSNTYFKIRVIATDTLGTTVYLNSVPLNESKLKILAGNTEHGLDGSALSAIFYMWGSSMTYGHKNKLVISEDGKVFYLDQLRGLLWIDTKNGILKEFISQTGVSSGDNGLVSSATVKSVTAIALDPYNDLIIYDYDLIRKIDLETMVITTIIGGGIQTDPLTTVNATEMKLSAFDSSWGNLIPLPNGDIIFTAPVGTTHHRKYRASDSKIEPMFFTGTGYTGNEAVSWASVGKLDIGIDYNPNTSQINFMAQSFLHATTGDSFTMHARINHTSGNETTPYSATLPYDLTSLPYHSFSSGLDGRLYSSDRGRTRFFRYDYITNTSTVLLGNGSSSPKPCPDGTLALSCPMNIDSTFVSRSGRIYFIDNGLVRALDDNNKIITLFGQYPSFGNGELTTTARFGNIQDIHMGKYSAANNKVIVQDIYSHELREVLIDGNVQKVADNYYYWAGPFSFDVDTVTGDIFSPSGNMTVQRFNRVTGTWANIIGAGSFPYHSTGDGHVGADIQLGAYSAQTTGFINGKLYYQQFAWNGAITMGCYIKSYDANDSYRQSHFMGTGNCDTSSTISAGTNLANQFISTNNVSKLRYFTDPNDAINKYFFLKTGTNKIYSSVLNGTISEFVDLGMPITSFTYKFAADGLNLFFCSDGSLYKHIYNTSQTVPLTWTSPTLKCKGTLNIIYNQERDSIIFPFTQNGLDGVAEYKLDP